MSRTLRICPPVVWGDGIEPTVAIVSSVQTKPTQSDVSSATVKPSMPATRSRQMTPPSFPSRRTNSASSGRACARAATPPVGAGCRPICLAQDLVRTHHVVVLVLEDVAVEGVLLRAGHARRQVERRTDPRYHSRVRGDRVLEAAVVGLERQRPARVEGGRVRVGFSGRPRGVERRLVARDVERAPPDYLELGQVEVDGVRVGREVYQQPIL